MRGIIVSEYNGRNNTFFQWSDTNSQGSTDFPHLGTEIALRFGVPNDIASVCSEERNKYIIDYDLHYEDLDTMQVLAYNRVKLFSKRWDLLPLPPEACDSFEGHRVHRVDGSLH